MNREFTRKELYDLVWSHPMKNIAADPGISDVALARKSVAPSIEGFDFRDRFFRMFLSISSVATAAAQPIGMNC